MSRLVLSSYLKPQDEQPVALFHNLPNRNVRVFGAPTMQRAVSKSV
jgi:hypothetical protein